MHFGEAFNFGGDFSFLPEVAPIISGPPFGLFDFVSEFLPDMHFGEAFNFGGDFSFLPEVDFFSHIISW
jgi:hypothetical protein